MDKLVLCILSMLIAGAFGGFVSGNTPVYSSICVSVQDDVFYQFCQIRCQQDTT